MTIKTPDDLAIADVYERSYDAKDQEYDADRVEKEVVAEGNLEGTPGLFSKVQERVHAGLIGGDCVATSRYKTQDVARAHHRLHASCKEAEGYATSAPLGDSVVVIVKSVNRVLLSLRTTLRSQLKLSEPTENRGRVVEAQLKIKS